MMNDLVNAVIDVAIGCVVISLSLYLFGVFL